MKRAILLAAFGSTSPGARRAFDHVEMRAKQAFPGVEIRWAYTSRVIRAKLAGRGKALESPEVALARLMDEGYTHVAVLSLHTIPGKEFHELHTNAQLFTRMAGGFECLRVARPLLSSWEDMGRVAAAMEKLFPRERQPADAVVLMGHGSAEHPADALYAAMNHVFAERTANVFVATVQGHPTLEDVLPKLRGRGVGKVYLMPFMSVAGEHVHHDMMGEHADSWRSVLTREGFQCEAVLAGTAEHPEVVEVWLDHLREAVGELEASRKR
jgi:sirohydrochlorin cobaltochelatase